MRPIPSPISREVFDLMNKAQSMVERIDVLSKAKCPDCEKTKMGCAKMGCGGKMAKADTATKDKYCQKNFGKKYSECSGNQKAQCDKACAKNDKMAKGSDGGTFTIGDASKRNAGFSPEPLAETDYSEAEGAYEYEYDYDDDDGNEKPMSMREDSTPARTLPLSEGKTRDQKRGDATRGVQVKKPGFRSSEPMPLNDLSASGKPEKIVDSMMGRRQKEKEGGGGHKASIFRHPMVGKSESGAQPGFNTSFDTKPQDIAFVSESGGQTRNAYYTTNQHLLDSDDVANKGATSVSVSLEKLASMLNPHEGGGASRLDDGGVLKNNPN